MDSARTLLKSMFDGKGEETCKSCIMTDDNGYGRETLLDVVASLCLASVFVMQNYIVGAHPFVTLSYLNPSRDGECLGDETDSDGERGEGDNGVGLSKDLNHVRDRCNAFTIDDSARNEQAVFMASKPLHSTGVGQRSVSAVAVREQGTSEVVKVLRLMHAVLKEIRKELDTGSLSRIPEI